MPTVSVIIPTYNRAALLAEAIASVRAQTWRDWELIIADDGSTDATAGVVGAEVDNRVRLLALEHSGNVARVRNAGVRASTGQWIAFLDSDDRWHPRKLARQLDRLGRESESRWSYTDVDFIDGAGMATAPRSGGAPHAQSGWVLERLLTFSAAATISTVLVARPLFDQVGGFDERFIIPSREDYDLVLRLAASSAVVALAEPLASVREHAFRSTRGTPLSELLRYNEMVFRKAEAAATSDEIRAICRRQRATQLRRRTRALLREGHPLAALSSFVRGGLARVGVDMI